MSWPGVVTSDLTCASAAEGVAMDSNALIEADQ